MNNVLEQNIKDSTSACGAMSHLNTQQKNNYYSFMGGLGTSASVTSMKSNIFASFDITTSGVSLPSPVRTTQNAVNQIKKLTGLTWEQLSKLFNVSRRTIHFWASGKRLSGFNEEQLSLVLDTIQYIDRGSATLNRSVLLMTINEISPFDLLVAGKYKEVKDIIGFGNPSQKPKLNPISTDISRLRTPISPENLIDALQEPVHRKVGRSRPAKSVRSRKHSSGQ